MRTAIAVTLFILLVGCAKVPDKLESPRMVIRSAIENDRVVYTVYILAGIQNRNSDLVIREMNGTLLFKDGNRSVEKTPLTAIPFTLKSIFPFETALLRLEARGDEAECRPLFELFRINNDELVKAGKTEDIYINEKFIKLDVAGCKTEKIYSVLRGNSNEKNK